MQRATWALIVGGILTLGPSVKAEPKGVPPLHCESGHHYFSAGDGTYKIVLQHLDLGNKRNATVCIEGASHNCDRPLIRNGVSQWKEGTAWIVNVAGENHIEVWQSEYDDGHASGGSTSECKSGTNGSAAIMKSTGGFTVTMTVVKQ